MSIHHAFRLPNKFKSAHNNRFVTVWCGLRVRTPVFFIEQNQRVKIIRPKDWEDWWQKGPIFTTLKDFTHLFDSFK